MTYRNLALVRAFSARMKCIGWILAMWCLGPIVAAYAQEDRGEIRVPPPASFSTDKLIPVAIAGPSELTVGLDPDHLSIGSDRIVRYVLIAQGANGLLTATFEGIDCKTASTRILARWNTTTQQWRLMETTEWKSLHDDRGSRYAKALARGGMCDGPTPTAPLSSMILALKTGRTSYNH